MTDQTINPPDLDDLLEESRSALLANLNCIQIGQLQKVNDDQTVEIKIQYLRRLPDGKTAKYPLLVDCPYIVISGGGAYLDMPVKNGDYCLVLFNDRNIDDWWDTANVAIPADTRKHSISDGFALVGINPKTKALANDGTFVRLLGTSGEGAEEFAARVDDPTTSTIIEDPAFWAWVALITSTVNSLSGGAVGPPPVSQSGKILSGSTEVKIG